MTFNFCGFLFLRIENLGTEKKNFVLQEATTEAMLLLFIEIVYFFAGYHSIF
jgi:uncharacterized membrane protein